MSAWLVIAAVLLIGLSGVPGVFIARTSSLGERLAITLLGLGAALGVGGAVTARLAEDPVTLAFAWPIPGGAFALHIDGIAAMFLLQIFVIAVCCAIYGLGYWPQREHPHNGRKSRLFYGLMTAGMALLVVAHNTVLFLFGWEAMALAAFLALTTEDENPVVREVGYVYLMATRFGSLCLFALFALLHAATGGFDFALGKAVPAPVALAIFVLGLVGFGLKAGIMPLHVWLPGAHANAPSHLSALMSGVMIKMGIYGLVRVTGMFTSPPIEWGVAVLLLGILSGVLGVAFAIGQHDIKRLLAYHSVENIGIICIGLGLALLGRSASRPELVALGLGGALLHTWNHGLFKALLFFSAGAVVHATHTREMDHLGGLLRSMPRTAVLFLIGAVAICGLPPLNGFVSELLVSLGLLRSTRGLAGGMWLYAGMAAASLALIGGLALACFAKVFGTVFLGEPRSAHTAHAREPGAAFIVPMVALALLCALIGLGPQLVVPVLNVAVRAWVPAADLAVLAPLSKVSVLACVLVVLMAAVWWLFGRRQPVTPRVPTWDCGYAQPDARMQYTASSFAQLLVGGFHWALRERSTSIKLKGVLPQTVAFHSETPEVVLDLCITPTVRIVARGLRWVRWLQAGNINAYLAYVFITLLIVFLWRGGQ